MFCSLEDENNFIVSDCYFKKQFLKGFLGTQCTRQMHATLFHSNETESNLLNNFSRLTQYSSVSNAYAFCSKMFVCTYMERNHSTDSKNMYCACT